jgi:lysyl-tRNA synthetase class 1
MLLIILKIRLSQIKNLKNQILKKKKALENLVLKLKEIDQSLKPEEIQTFVYSIGKENGYEKNLRDWFKLIYEVVFGEENGPRMGYFISFFGLNETIELINEKIK